MQDVVVVGAGKIGATVAGLLASTGRYQVTLADRLPAVLDRVEPHERIRCMPLNVEDTASLLGLLNDKFAVINAAPFHLTLRIAEAARAAPHPLSRPDRGRGEHAAREGACRRRKHRLHPAVRARSGLRVRGRLRAGEK